LDRIQRSGVRTEKVQPRTVARAIRVPATVRTNERKLAVVTLRAEGYIEELHVNAIGEPVKAGEPLFRLYSPPLVQAQLEYALAVKAARNARDANQTALVEGAARKLRSLGMPESRIKEIQQGGTVPRTIDWPAPVTGAVLEKKVISGQRVMAGDELYRIADLSTVWVIAEVPERDLGSISTNSAATVTFRAFPNQPIEAISSTCWKLGKPPLWRFPSTKDHVKRFSMPAGALVGAPVGARFHPTLARCQRLDSHCLRAHSTIKRPRVSTDHLVRQTMLQRHGDSPPGKPDAGH
jgi:multidrug efflux pump subunit AcrA (membrane-fusion protein)